MKDNKRIPDSGRGLSYGQSGAGIKKGQSLSEIIVMMLIAAVMAAVPMYRIYNKQHYI